MLLEDFGLWVDLVRRIREVLANYPEGTTALRDAGSSSRTPTMPGPRASASASTAAPMGPARCSPPRLHSVRQQRRRLHRRRVRQHPPHRRPQEVLPGLEDRQQDGR